jgi:two-component system, OmpR family, response regulator
MVPSQTHILVVDNEKGTRDYLQTMFKDAGFRVTCAADGHSALRVIRREAVDLTIVDVATPGASGGREMVRTARAERPALKAMFISADAEPPPHPAQHDDYISKPFYGKEILGCVYKMLLHDRNLAARQALRSAA